MGLNDRKKPIEQGREEGRLKSLRNTNATIWKVFRKVGEEWSDDRRKVELLERLFAYGFFPRRIPNLKDPKDRHLIPYNAFRHLRVTTFPPYMLLLLSSISGDNHADIATHLVQPLEKENQAAIMLFLESYLNLSKDERLSLQESYPFYSAQQLYVQTQIIDLLLNQIAAVTGIAPTEDYYGRQVT